MGETTASLKEEKESNLEETAREQLGLARWDRPAIFREAADAATDADLPYWTILLLSGAIATLGLALDSAAVVIGAMLIAPLLAPVVGLALALAMGDGRLAVMTAATVFVSTLAVVLAAVLLTLTLPFQTVTPEILARTKPTTLDLAIAVFSGLAGAVVTVARGKRLSAAIPGVAISVALIPPLAVAGFAIGSGWQWSLIRGSLLLFGANLAGIVLSGMSIFLLIGMHRRAVCETTVHWHREANPTGLTAWISRMRWVRSLGAMHAPLARLGLVLGFVVAVSIPLSISLGEITRQTKVQQAISAAAEMFNLPGRSSVLNLEHELGEKEAKAFLRVATTAWFSEQAREAFERTASAQAGEPVYLVLEQLPATAGDLEQLTRLLQDRGRPASPAPRPASPPPLPELLAPAWERVGEATRSLTLPEDAHIAGADLVLQDNARSILHVGYTAAQPLPPPAQQILTRQLTTAMRAPALTVVWNHIDPPVRDLSGTPADTSDLQHLAGLLLQYEDLRADVAAGPQQQAAAETTVQALVEQGVPAAHIRQRSHEEAVLRVRLYPATRDADETAAGADSGS